MYEKLIPFFALAGLILLFIMGNQVLAVVVGFTIVISFAAMSLLERSGKKNHIKEPSNDDNDKKNN